MAKTDPYPVRFPKVTHDYLTDLVKKGFYGKNKTEVIRRFVDAGIRRAVRSKDIAERTADEEVD